MWLGRILKVLPEVIGLWEAVHADDEQAALDAALTLRRKMADEQARETMGA